MLREFATWPGWISIGHCQHKRRYGARRIAVELAARGVDRVAKLLKMPTRREQRSIKEARDANPPTFNGKYVMSATHTRLSCGGPPTLQQGWRVDATGKLANFTQNDQADRANTLDQQRMANR